MTIAMVRRNQRLNVRLSTWVLGKKVMVTKYTAPLNIAVKEPAALSGRKGMNAANPNTK